MINRDYFDKIKVTRQTSKYIFKISDSDDEIPKNYKVDGDCIIFRSIEQMYEFQRENAMKEYKPFLYNCEECGYRTDRKSSYDDHRETDKCRAERELEPLSKAKKMERKNLSNRYHCRCCNYTPKTETSRNSIRVHTRSKKHIKNCEEEGVAITDCLTPVIE